MPHSPRLNRRNILKAGLMAAASAGAMAGEVAHEATIPEIEGPFRPDHDREDEDHDLTQVKGRDGKATGEIVHIRGRVVDTSGKPVAKALVEIWQANHWGRYDHERDASNPKPLDPNFQGWAELLSGDDGSFAFKTIKPGSYPADNNGWIRPPHIHFRVALRGYHELTTQMYFTGEPLNEKDLLRRDNTPEELARVTVEFKEEEKLPKGERAGFFEIVLRPVTRKAEK